MPHVALELSSESGEPRAGRPLGDPRHVLGLIDVAEPGDKDGTQAERGQPRLLVRAGGGQGHRHPVEHCRRCPLQSEAPEPAVVGGPEDGVGAEQGREHLIEKHGRDLGCVHADDERGHRQGREGIVHGAREARAEVARALRDDVNALGQPVTVAALEGQDHTDGRARERSVEGVNEGGTSQRSGTRRPVRRDQPRLHLAGQRFLGHDDDLGGGHAAIT